MKEGLLIYGCYGYTGKLISEQAMKSGLKPVLAGRNEQKVKALAEELNLPYRVFDLTDGQNIIDNIGDIKVVLHCAGPFMSTGPKMASACIKAKTHYLDITGDYQVFEEIFKMNKVAEDAGVLLMPGVGFDVVPTDCLAMYLKEKLPSADSLEIAMYLINGMLSSGTAITIIDNIAEGGVVRKDGNLKKIKNGEVARVIDYGDKKRSSAAIPWGDVSTAFHSTGIPNITVYISIPKIAIAGMKLGNSFNFLLGLESTKKNLARLIKLLPPGPGEKMRKKARCLLWGEVKNHLGEIHQATLEIPGTYTLTEMTSVKIAENILTKEPPHGTRTPAQVFGKDFILQFEGVKRKDLN